MTHLQGDILIKMSQLPEWNLCFFWRETLKDIQQQYAKNCDICQKCKPVLAGSHV